MSKRLADKYLTDQNWDDEEEPQEAGVFKAADDDVLKERVIKKAKRRNMESSSSSGSGAFAGFGGLKTSFGITSTNGFKGFNLPSSTPQTGLFTSNSEKPIGFQPKGFGDVSSSSTEKPVPSEPAKVSEKPKPTFISPVKSQASEVSSANLSEDQKVSEYNRHLSALNKSVSRWILDHVEKNDLCDLTPVFKDYEKHLKNIDEKYGENSQTECDSSQSTDNDSKPQTKLTMADPKQSAPVTEIKKPELTKAKPVSPPKPLFAQTTKSASPFKGFGSFTSTSKPTTSGFTGFQFGSSMVIAPAPSQSSSQPDSQTSNEEEYVPPKSEVEVVKEDDAFYTKKCKLFYMKEDAYTDKGVGHIHLKPVPSTNKTQLIVRADTALGNVLLNIVLNPAMPITKQGKNNVSISCVPNPPIDEKDQEKVVPMLIRVKTSDDADELEKLLNEKKKAE